MNKAWQLAGWRVVRLAEIATLCSGGTPSRKRTEFFTGDMPWLTGQDIPEGTVSDVSKGREYVTEQAIKNSATRIVPVNTILVTTRVSVGKVAVAACPLCFSQDVTGVTLRSPEIAIPHFVAYFLMSQRQKLLQRNQGSTIVGITRDSIAHEQIPLPPITEQMRIVEILQEAEQIGNLHASAETKTAKLIPTIFDAMFGDPVTNPHQWDIEPLGNLIQGTPKNGLYKPSTAYGSGTPIIRIGDFYNGRLVNPNNLQRLQVTDKELLQFEVRNGDILVNRVNSIEYLGKSTLVTGLTEPSVFESNMMRLQMDLQKLLPEFLNEVLQHPSVLRILRGKAK